MTYSSIGINTGSDAQVRTDFISGSHHQLMKVVVGAEGEATPVSTSTPFPTILQTGAAFVGQVGQKFSVVSASLTRVASPGSYVANTAITNSASTPTPITFASMAQVSNGSGVIKSVILISSSDSANTVGLVSDMELWVFDSTPTSNNDAASFSLSDSDVVKVLGVVPFKSEDVRFSGLNYVIPGDLKADGLPFVCSGGSVNLFGLLVTRGAYAAVASEVFTFRFVVQQN